MSIVSSVDIGEGIVQVVVDHDPTSVATDVAKGSLIFESSTGIKFIKTDDGATTNVKKFHDDAGNIFAGANETTLSNVENLKVSLAETTDPTTTNDVNEGYSVGSRWVNVSLDKLFVCADNTVSAAVWLEITPIALSQTLSVGNSTGGTDIQFSGTDKIAGSLGNSILEFSDVASAVNFLRLINAATGSGPILLPVGSDADIDLEVKGKGTGDVLLQVSGGNVGIGVPSPTESLDIAGNIALTGSLNRSLKIGDGIFTLATTSPNQVRIDATGFFLFRVGGVEKLILAASDARFNGPGNDVNFIVEAVGAPNALFVEGSSGNVGIGTPTPGAKLDIAATGDGVAILKLSTERAWQFIQDGVGAAAHLTLHPLVDGKQFIIKSQDLSKTYLIVSAKDDGSGTVSFPTGNVGIGTPTPVQLLDVAGIIRAQNLRLIAGGLFILDDTALGNAHIKTSGAGGKNIVFVTDNAETMQLRPKGLLSTVAHAPKVIRTAVNNNTAAMGVAHKYAVTDTSVARTITISSADILDVDREFIIKDESGGAGGATNITIVTENVETIDGEATVAITVDFGVVKLYSNGVNLFSF